MPFLDFSREKIDLTSYNYDRKIYEFDKVPNDSHAYGIVKTDEYLDANDLVDIVNDTLPKNEYIKILKTIENLTSNCQNNFADIVDDYDN